MFIHVYIFYKRGRLKVFMIISCERVVKMKSCFRSLNFHLVEMVRGTRSFKNITMSIVI